MNAAPRRIPGGITAPRGFVAGSTEAGIRASGGLDLVMVATDGEAASGAGTFTTNRFRAAPVLLAESALRASGGRCRGVVINAGCANAGTGPAGLEDARTVVRAAAERLGCSPDEVLPASTGLIGSRLPTEAMVRALSGIRLTASAAAGRAAAEAIMTTDTRRKERAVAVHLPDGRVLRLGGMAKGAGMIHPQMATMLALLTTDAAVEPASLGEMLRTAVERTFNQVTVDGDTSTNDTVILLASGAAGGPPISPEGADRTAFADALGTICRELAIAIADDGEGAEHLIAVEVMGATDDAAARAVARTVAGSNLVKAAVHGRDPNWGRIAAAAGRSGQPLEMDLLRICIGQTAVYAGAPLPFDQRAARRALRGRKVRLLLDFGLGDGHGVAWGCDLSAEYVAINSEYTT